VRVGVRVRYGLGAPAAARKARRMQQWEYATAPLISHALQEILNNWGDEGYELVCVVDNVAYFKRPKQ
jgi:hypothetical protein